MATTTVRRPPARPVVPAVRALLGAFAALTAAGFTTLFVLADQTERTFAWTIEPPLTAAILGAGYGAGLVLSLLSLRARAWADVRVPYLAVLAFTWLTALATALHLDRMHTTAPGAGPLAEPAAWLWLGVYVAVPVAMAALLPVAERAPGADPPPAAALPGWCRAVLAVEGALMGVVGAVLFVAPATAAVVWPWALTPLTARVVAAWLLALAVAVVLAVRADDLARLRSSTVAFAVFGVLQLLALARFPGSVRWGSAAALAWLVLLVAVTATGVVGRRLAGAVDGVDGDGGRAGGP